MKLNGNEIIRWISDPVEDVIVNQEKIACQIVIFADVCPEFCDCISKKPK